jgi:tagatose 1,6-diphosphate aldolase
MMKSATLSVGKLRGLQQLATPEGVLAMCAIDHRESLKRALGSKNPNGAGYEDMVNFKLDLCRAVAAEASAVLLDPVYGAAQAIAAGVLPGSTGLLVSLEETGYTGEPSARLSTVLSGWSVAKVKRMGASAVKLLIYFRPDIKAVAAKQLDLVSRLADECLCEDIPLLVEVVSYPVDAEKASPARFAQKKPELVIEAARLITALPVDILKTEFPADLTYETDEARLSGFCCDLDSASRLPWVLLSAGAGFEVFRREVSIAVAAGASGFLAGRALWQEAVELPSREARRGFFLKVAAPRLRELAAMAKKYARPWYTKMGFPSGEFPPVSPGWYQGYPE